MQIEETRDSTSIKLEEVQAPQQPWKPTLHELLILIFLAVISLMVALDATIVTTALGAITNELQASTTEAFWVGTSYLLASAATMPYLASLSDIFGRPSCLFASLVAFTVGSVLCSVAKNIATLLVGRCFQGVGAGGVMILSLVICTDFVPLRYRAKYYGFVLAAWAIGTCVGPVFGGLFVQHTTWRWIFYLMFPFCIIGIVTLPWILTLSHKKPSGLKEKLARVDTVGGFLFISSTTSFLIAISWGGSQQPWSSVQTLLPLLAGVAGLTVTGIWESHYAEEPFLRRSLFHCASSYITFFGGLAQGLLLYTYNYYIPFYFLSVHAASPVQTGIGLLPVALAFAPTSVVIGQIITRVNRFRWAIWIGWLITTIACGLTIIWNLHTSASVWVPIAVLFGIGNGFVLNSQNFGAQAVCLPHDEAAAAAMYCFARSFGSALGVGIASSIFQNCMKVKLREFSLPLEIARNSEIYAAQLAVTPDSQLKTNILKAYVYGFCGVIGMLTAVAGVAGILSLFIGHFELDKKLDTEHRLRDSRLVGAVHRRRTSGVQVSSIEAV